MNKLKLKILKALGSFGVRVLGREVEIYLTQNNWRRMFPTKKIKIESVSAFCAPGDPDNLVIVGLQADSGSHIILADYRKSDGLESHYNLISILSKSQQLSMGNLIDNFDPEGGAKR